MMSILQPSFMRHCQILQIRIEELITTLRKRPDTLEAFTDWLAEVLGHLLPGVAAGIGTGKGLTMVATKESMMFGQSLHEQAKDRTMVLTEFDSLRSLLGLLRWV